MTNEKIRQNFEQLEQLLKQKRHRKTRHSSSSSSKVGSDMKAFYASSHERRERRLHKIKRWG